MMRVNVAFGGPLDIVSLTRTHRVMNTWTLGSLTGMRVLKYVSSGYSWKWADFVKREGYWLKSICTQASIKHFVMRALLLLSVSPLFCSYLSLSLHLHSSSFSPREQAVAKKQIGEPEYVLDMLFFPFLNPL